MEKHFKQIINQKPLEVCLGNNAPILTLTCHECGLVKKSAEEMEIHIKIEHIEWLPYKCPHCQTHRASDSQMREHIHASHKASPKEFIYVDNMEAKRSLMKLMDQALYATVAKKMGEDGYDRMSPEASTTAHSTTSSDSPPGEPSSPTGLEDVLKIAGGDSNTEALLAQITREANSQTADTGLDALTMLLESYRPEKVEGEIKEETIGDISLQFMDKLFGKNLTETSFEVTPNKKTNVQQSKKKVVGMCKACNKPVTAGARQMHLFYHMAKDRGVYRFYCKHDGCPVEHYRKDQMEHHMTKTHGAINPELIGDRTDVLYQTSKELQQELLGEMSIVSNSTDSPSSALKRPATSTPSHPPDDKQTLQCNICKKFMENRVKGFHILHHLARDKGILRYTCKLCDFAHDRSQSVLGHGKKEHGREDVVMDRIGDYEDEVNEMSQKCFAIDTNFETSKKKTKGSPYIMKKPKMEEENDDQSDPDETQEDPFPSTTHSQEIEEEDEDES